MYSLVAYCSCNVPKLSEVKQSQKAFYERLLVLLKFLRLLKLMACKHCDNFSLHTYEKPTK